MVARQDLTTDPALRAELLRARRGTAFFARKLNELSDAELDGDSRLPGWSRRHVVAHIGYNARAIARLAEWARTGVMTPMYESAAVRDQEIDVGATLSPIALRHLFDHSAVHLNVEWRDLPDDSWGHSVRTIQGREVPAAETVWMRTREIWVHAVDLDNGASFQDVPAEVLERLVTDITATWKTRGEDIGLVLEASDSQTRSVWGDSAAGNSDVVTGTLAGLAEWATGRGAAGVSSRLTPLRDAPRWL
jgi:maleylpyruvate isomerase